MKRPEDPLAWWEISGTRRAVAISAMAGLIIASLAIVPAISRFYDEHAVLRDCLDGLVVLLGLLLGWLELKHSGEANDYRAEQTRLMGIANQSRIEANENRAEANRLSDENNELQRETLELQQRIYEIQEGVEKKRTKVRLHVRAQLGGNKLKFLVSNLSDFDLLLK